MEITYFSLADFTSLSEMKGEITPNEPSNTTLGWVCANVWCNYCNDIAPKATIYLVNLINQHGLEAAIKIADDEATALIASLNRDCGSVRWTYNNSYIYGEYESALIHQFVISNTWLHDILAVLRYPKRYSKANDHALFRKGLDAFQEVNRSRTDFDKPLFLKNDFYQGNLRWSHYRDQFVYVEQTYIGRRLKEIYRRMLPFTPIKEDPQVSPGTTADAARDTYNKYAILASHYPVANCLIPFSGKVAKPWSTPRALKVRAVPKSYKKPRIIGVRDVITLSKSYDLARAVHQSLSKGKIGTVSIYDSLIIPDIHRDIDDAQSVIRDRIAEASRSVRGIATTDLSNASDSISWSFRRRLFPEWVTAAEAELRPEFLVLQYEPKPQTFKNNIASTSGDPHCFPLEEPTFTGIAALAVDLAAPFIAQSTGESISSVRRRGFESIRDFGDDLSLSSEFVETFFDLLEAFGLSPNREKSFFGEHPYREACGVEYCNGIAMHHPYFPRKTFEKEDEFMAALVEHHNILVCRGGASASSWLRKYICDSVKGMTFSTISGREMLEIGRNFPFQCDVPDLLGNEGDLITYGLPYTDVDPETYVHYSPKEQNIHYEDGRFVYDHLSVEKVDRFADEHVHEHPKYLGEKHISLQRRLSRAPSKQELEKAEQLAYREFLEFGPLVEEELTTRHGFDVIDVSVSRSRVQAACDSLFGTLEWR